MVSSKFEATEFTDIRCNRCESPVQVTSPSASYCAACWDEVKRRSPWLRGSDYRAGIIPDFFTAGLSATQN